MNPTMEVERRHLGTNSRTRMYETHVNTRMNNRKPTHKYSSNIMDVIWRNNTHTFVG
jgi:hypothetical protein